MARRRRWAGTLAVLEHLLYADEPAQYALSISEATGLASGVVLTVLAGLEHDGWVVSDWDGVDPATEGRPRRRTYQLTPLGRGAALHDLSRTDFGSFAEGTDAVTDWIPPVRVDDHLLALFVRLLPRPVRARFDEEVGGELAASRHPVEDALSLVLSVPGLRGALGIPPQRVGWRCRLGRHEDVRIRTDQANHQAFYLRCLRCGRERHPSGGLAGTEQEQAAWMTGGAAMGGR